VLPTSVFRGHVELSQPTQRGVYCSLNVVFGLSGARCRGPVALSVCICLFWWSLRNATALGLSVKRHRYMRTAPTLARELASLGDSDPGTQKSPFLLRSGAGITLPY